ncbi:hypothetical protein CRENBAI_021850 [Crenichthys baileyi]|uniref:Uncharacterized protein n=1 Tax=Crenichthys baileyi TaxID=28760 RepID=A0AAV9RIB9_9TELE
MITLQEYFQRETEKVYAGLRIWWSSNRHSGALSWRSLLLEPTCGDTTPLLLPNVNHQPVVEDADIIHSPRYQNLCSVPHNSSVRVSTAPHLHHSCLLHLPSLCLLFPPLPAGDNAIIETLPSPFQRIWSPLLFLQRVTLMPSILFQRVWSMPSSFPRRFRARLRLHRLLLSVPKPRILPCPSPLFQCPPVVNNSPGASVIAITIYIPDSVIIFIIICISRRTLFSVSATVGLQSSCTSDIKGSFPVARLNSHSTV